MRHPVPPEIHNREAPRVKAELGDNRSNWRSPACSLPFGGLGHSSWRQIRGLHPQATATVQRNCPAARPGVPRHQLAGFAIVLGLGLERVQPDAVARLQLLVAILLLPIGGLGHSCWRRLVSAGTLGIERRGSGLRRRGGLGPAAGAASLPQSAMELETMSAICMGRRLTKTGSGSSRRLNAPLGLERREFGLERRVFGLQRPACSLFR